MNGNLNVLLLKDGVWTAQCLEHDIASQGETIQEAMFELTRTLVAEVCLCAARGDEGLDSIPPAPRFYWSKYHEVGEQLRGNRLLPPFKPDCSLPPAFMLPRFGELRVA